MKHTISSMLLPTIPNGRKPRPAIKLVQGSVSVAVWDPSKPYAEVAGAYTGAIADEVQLYFDDRNFSGNEALVLCPARVYVDLRSLNA